MNRRFALLLPVFCLLWGVQAQGQPVQTCTVTNIRGFPVDGVVCGGSTHGLSCTAGAIYRCKSGNLGDTNNCKLSQACTIGCITGPTTGTLSDSHLNGTYLNLSINS